MGFAIHRFFKEVQMAGISSSTSLDVNSIVSQLMQIEGRRKTLLQRNESDYQLKLSAVGNLSSTMSSFKSALDTLRSASNFQSIKAASGDSTVFTASASSTAAAGTYNLEVTQLAKTNMLASGAYTDTASAIATGTLAIQVGTGSAKAVTIDSTNNTLSGIRDAVNKAGTDVTASIINDGTGYKLLLTSNKMGASNTIKVTVDGDSDGNNTDAAGLSNLLYDPAGTKNMTEIQAAQSATMKMGTLTITKDSNTVTDVVPGVTLNLLKAQPGTPVSLTVSNDTSVVSSNVNKFVSEFNKLAKTMNDMTGKGGSLVGDGIVRIIESEMRSVIGSAIPGLTSGLNSLSQIGVKTERDGSLSVDGTKLDAAIKDNFNDIVKLFAKVGSAADANISMTSSTSKTVAGTYAIDITQASTQGKIVGGTAVGSLIITSGSNDALNLSINGVSGSITIAGGTYASGGALASEIQSKINGASAFSSAGISASVSYDGGTGRLTITSNTYGSTSKVDTISGNAAANLGLDSGVSTGGVDVAGTIGGYAATGSGQKLTGSAGTPVEGLVINVLGSATGSRGSFTYSIGTAESIFNKLNTWLDSGTGIIKSKTDAINASLKSVEKAIEREDLRLELAENRLRAQFSALASMLDRMQGVSSFLTSQSAGLEKLIKG
jgi:flagellar hook-associated protein 2